MTTIIIFYSFTTVTLILSFCATFIIDFVNSFVNFDKILSLIFHQPGNFKAGAINAKSSFVS